MSTTKTTTYAPGAKRPEIIMLSNHAMLSKFLARNPNVDHCLIILSKDSIGFRADIGTRKNERFDYPFNSGAFYEILGVLDGPRRAADPTKQRGEDIRQFLPEKKLVLGGDPIYVAQCPQESFFVRCSLPDGHAGECNFPANPALDYMRDVLKAQIALWNAQGALEGHVAAVEFKEIDVTEESTSEAAGVYSDAHDIDSEDDAAILRIYQAVLAFGAAGAANVEAASPGRGIRDLVKEARTLAREAEFAIRIAAKKANGSNGATPAWIVLSDLIKAQAKIHERLALLADLLKIESAAYEGHAAMMIEKGGAQ